MSRKYQLILIGFLFGLCSSITRGQDCYLWTDRTPPPPGGHSGARTVFDSKRNVLIAIGGTYGLNTWEWDGIAWNIRSSNTPAMGNVHQAVFDTVRGVTVVFIGGTAGTTWEWDGTLWTLKSEAGPGPRIYFELAFDPQRGVTVLHGGRDISNEELYFNDTWEWDGTNWLLRSTSGPTRGGHAMTYDSIRGVTVLHGGLEDSSTFRRDTWEWDGDDWIQVAMDNGPFSIRYEMVFDASRGKAILFYRPSSSEWLEEWTWDGLTWNSATTPGPVPRYDFPVSFDPQWGTTMLFGGSGWGDLWEWNGNEWMLKAGGSPAVSALAYHRAQDRIMAVEARAGIARMWKREGNEWTFVDSNGPAMGNDPAMVYDEARNVLVLFGGSNTATNPDTFYGNTWEWDGVSWDLRAISGPSPRSRHRMVYDASREVVVLFGGWHGIDTFNGDEHGDTWEWDGVAWTLRSTTGPSPRFWHGFIYDRERNVSVLVGGGFMSGIGVIAVGGGTWEWDGQNWAQRTNQPLGRYLPVLVFDELRHVSLLVGGYDIGPLDGPVYYPGTREWDGNSWIQRTTQGTIIGTGVFDVASGKNLVISGSETWEYFLEATPPGSPVAETWNEGAGTFMTIKNRYLSFSPPALPDGASGLALRVSANQLPGSTDCPNVPDFSGRFQGEMWVGDEVLHGNLGTGLYQLSDSPVFRDWSTVPGGVIHVADCNVVPCAAYSIEAASDMPCNLGVPAVFSEPLIVSTSPIWADLVGAGSNELPNGVVDFVDIAAMVERFRSLPTAPPGTWCDLGGSSPYQGVNFNIDFGDIALVVDAFRGKSYPFAGPTAPDPCP